MRTINELASTLLVVAFLLALACLSFKSCSGAPSVTVEALKKEIDRESPIGCHYSVVIRLLDAKRILHSDYEEAKEFDPVKNEYVKLRTIGAQISVVKRNRLTAYGIYLRFYFDADGRLIEYTVARRRTDP